MPRSGTIMLVLAISLTGCKSTPSVAPSQKAPIAVQAGAGSTLTVTSAPHQETVTGQKGGEGNDILSQFGLDPTRAKLLGEVVQRTIRWARMCMGAGYCWAVGLLLLALLVKVPVPRWVFVLLVVISVGLLIAPGACLLFLLA